VNGVIFPRVRRQMRKPVAQVSVFARDRHTAESDPGGTLPWVRFTVAAGRLESYANIMYDVAFGHAGLD